ncbi:hypothetical protein QF002_007363 [Paraburkholderia youngii]
MASFTRRMCGITRAADRTSRVRPAIRCLSTRRCSSAALCLIPGCVSCCRRTGCACSAACARWRAVCRPDCASAWWARPSTAGWIRGGSGLCRGCAGLGRCVPAAARCVARARRRRGRPAGGVPQPSGAYGSGAGPQRAGGPDRAAGAARGDAPDGRVLAVIIRLITGRCPRGPARVLRSPGGTAGRHACTGRVDAPDARRQARGGVFFRVGVNRESCRKPGHDRRRASGLRGPVTVSGIPDLPAGSNNQELFDVSDEYRMG